MESEGEIVLRSAINQPWLCWMVERVWSVEWPYVSIFLYLYWDMDHLVHNSVHCCGVIESYGADIGPSAHPIPSVPTIRYSSIPSPFIRNWSVSFLFLTLSLLPFHFYIRGHTYMHATDNGMREAFWLNVFIFIPSMHVSWIFDLLPFHPVKIFPKYWCGRYSRI